MARYDVFEAGFSNLDETINFGKRAIGGDKSLYEICTLAVIRSSEKTLGSDALKITSSYELDGKIFFGINDCLRIVKNIEQPDQIASFEFEHCLDSIAVSPSGKFLLVCTHNGEVFIYDLSAIRAIGKEENGCSVNGDKVKIEETNIKKEESIKEEESVSYEFPVIFKETIEHTYTDDGENCFIGTFVEEISELPIFYVVTYRGLVTKIELTPDEKDAEQFSSQVVYDFKRNIRICAFAYPFLCLEGSQLLILDLIKFDCDIDDALGLKSLHAMGRNFLAFDNGGNVFKIDSARCMIFGLNDELPHLVNVYDNLLVLADGDKGCTIGVTKNESNMQLSSLLESNMVYDIPVAQPIYLINLKVVTQEALFLAEVRKNGVLSEIRLQYVTETDPELRVKKLIQKGLVDKAELFAQAFNVNPEFLAEAKAGYIAENLECTTEQVDELLKNLDSITDHSFRMHCCDSVMCETASDTRRVLCHGAFMEINVRDSSKNDDNLLLFMKKKFNCRLRRFDTYMQVYREYNKRKWSYFADCDLIDEVTMFLLQGQMEEAALIYSRLGHDEIALLTDERIEQVTNILNKSLKTGTTFLNTFIPLTLKYKPDALMIFVNWVHDRVYQLEKESDFDFPDCAINFLQVVTSLMNMYIPARSNFGDECREVLTYLLKALNNIQMLFNNFSIKLPLSEYLSAPHDLVRTLLSEELQPTHLELLMKEFLYPFMKKSGVDADDILIKEMKGLFVYDEEYWLNIVHVLLMFVCRVDKKLEAIKEILEIAAKPWSDKVKDVAKMAFERTSTSPIAEEIAEMLRDEHILYVLQKYNINRRQFVSLGEKSFYFHRILYLNRENCKQAIEDIHQLCRDKDDRLHADLFIIKEFIIRGNTEKAMTFIDNLEPKTICILGKELLEDILLIGESDTLPVKFREAYRAALNPLWNRLSRHGKGREKEDMSYVYNVANAIYGIYSHFGIKVNSSVLKTRQKEDILAVLFQRVLELIISEKDPSSFETLIRNCKNLASVFGESLDSMLLKFMKFEDNFSMCLNIGNHLLEASHCRELLTLCAVYIFKYSKDSFSNVGDETFLDVIVAANKNNPDDDFEAVRLARKLCIKALMCSTEVDQMPVLEVLRWIDSCYYLSDIGEQLYVHAEVHQIYLSNIKPYYFAPSFDAIKMIFNVYCAFVESLRIDDLKYLTYFKSNRIVTPEEFLQEHEQLLWNVGVLLKQGQHLISFNMIKVVQRSCVYYPDVQEEILKLLQQFLVTRWLPEAIDAVMSQKYIDKTQLLNMMLLFDKKEFEEQLSKCLSVYKKQPKKLNAITQVGLNLLTHHGIKYGKDDLLNILNLCKWWFRINDPKMKYESFFTSKPEPRMELLIKDGKVTLENLPEYCTDFGLDLQYSLLQFLKIILLNWQPEVEYMTEVSGKKNIIIKNSENELMSKCSKIVDCIDDKNEVFKLTKRIWPLTNFYYYEVYLVLLLIHRQVAQSGGTIPAEYRSLLFFLKTYKRVSIPTRSEIEQWYGAFPFKALIDPLSEFRLPLTKTFLSNDIWNIIKQEVNLDTYKEWFKVTPILLYLTQQDICTYAINSPLASGLISTTCNTWELSIKYDHLLPKVDECAQNISDWERATAAVYTLMCGMPPGADKVQMAKLSYKYAKLYREAKTDDEDVEKVYVKVKQRYLNYSAFHILHKYQLAEDKYLKQVAQPTDLIWELYNDSRIEPYFDNLIFDCPDINRAVEELCLLFALSIKKESYNVLSKLLKSNCPLDLDCRRLQRGADSIHLKRACYLCKCQDEKNWQKTLIEQGTKSSIENDMSFKANALRCFYYISDTQTVTEMSKMSHEQFVTYLDKVSVIAKMGDLGIKFDSVQQLDQQNQKRLLKNLAKINKPLAIKCIASVCRIYGLDDLTYWEYIVNTAVQFHMVGELQDYVQFLKDRCASECIKNAWHVILADSFSNLNVSESEIFLLLQTCPVISQLDLESYIQKCKLSERPGVADTLRQFQKKLNKGLPN